jgi:DUF1680 family protein
VESLGDYIYAKSDKAIWVNLFVGSATTIALKNGNIQVEQKSNYPWDGTVQIKISPNKKLKFPLNIRIPGWAQNSPVPGSTYRYLDNSQESFTLLVNGRSIAYKLENGYAVIDREWKKGDEVSLNLPMQVRKVVAIDSLKDNRNRVSLQRGPLVYCFEHADNEGKVMNIFIPDNTRFTSQYNASLLQGVVTLQAQSPVVTASADGMSVSTVYKKVTAIPYYAWANRGNGQMQVWVPRKVGDIKVGAVKSPL